MPAELELSPPLVLWPDVTAEAGIDFVRADGEAGEKKRTISPEVASAATFPR